MNLRFVNRDGKMILQMRQTSVTCLGSPSWEDVPTVKEQKRVTVTVEMELAKKMTIVFDDATKPGLTCYSQRGEILAKVAIDFFKARLRKCEYRSWTNRQDIERELFGEA